MSEPLDGRTGPLRALLDGRAAFRGFLLKRLHDPALADDVLQEAYAKGLERLPSLRDEQAAVAWFYQLLRNAVTDHGRRSRTASKALERLSEEVCHLPVTRPSGVACRCVLGLSNGLDPAQEAALRRIELDGVSVKEFAAEAGITSNNAGVRVFRARETLRRRVLEACGACATAGCLDCDCEGTP